MFCVVRKYRVRPDAKEQAVEKAEKHYVDVVSDSPGFVGFYVVNEDEAVLTISLFQTQAESEASNAKAAHFVREHLAGLVEGPLEVVQGPIYVSKVAEAK